jgi:hypothetical protein
MEAKVRRLSVGEGVVRDRLQAVPGDRWWRGRV